MARKVVCLLFAVLMIFNLTACSQKTSKQSNSFDKDKVSNLLKNGEIIAQNESFALEWVSTSCSVVLLDKKTGARWGTAPTKEGEPELDSLGLPIKKHPQLESVLTIGVFDYSTMVEEEMLSYTSCVKNGRVNAKTVEDGIRVEYYFDDAEIMIPLVYTLREDSVSVSIDTKNIQENDKVVTYISIAPFWCLVENDKDDTYLFHPSGSGALIDGNTISASGITYSPQVYGDDPVVRKTKDETTEKSVRLPVYGAKTDYGAICAIIENASESAIIEAKVGSSAIGYSSVYTKFLVRGYSSNLVNFMKGLEKNVELFSQNRIETTATVSFYPLSGEDANYTGMAKTYKNYLKTNGLLNKSEETVLNLTFVGGVMVKKSFLGIPYEGLLAATTISDVEEILKEISQKTKTKINVRLIGFGDTGLNNSNYAGGFAINSKLGSLSDLEQLNDYCKSNSIKLYFDFDLITLKNSSSGFSSLFDTAYSPLNKIADIYEYDIATRRTVKETKYNLLKRENLFSGADKLYDEIENWDIDGISLATLSNIAYSDYSDSKDSRYYSKNAFGNDTSKIMSKFSKKYNIAVSDANAYSVSFADVIFDAPSTSSQENIFSEDIPFYQMVFKGFVAMSGDNINQVSNSNQQFLKTVESGCGLAYMVTQEYHNDFIDHKGYEFFNSKYSDISKSIIDDFERISDYYNAIEGSQIISHTILDNGLRETVFDNGVKVYVNYTDIKIDGVEAGDFMWRGEI